MGLTLRNRNLDAFDSERPIYVDPRGRLMVNPGLDGDVFKAFFVAQAVGTNKVFLDLFNAAADKNVEIVAVNPIFSGAAAVTGVLAVDMFLTRTTNVGTGGTALTAEGATLTASTIAKLDPASAALPSGITARLAPAGGATAGAILGYNSMFSEETNAATSPAGSSVSVPVASSFTLYLPDAASASPAARK